MTDKNKAQECKANGNTAFKEQRFNDAIDHFTDAIEADPTDHVLYSNRSGAYMSLTLAEDALEDAEKCVELNPAWAKGYSRLGTAKVALGLYDEAKESYKKGLEVDPANTACKDGMEHCNRRDAASSGGMPGGFGGMGGMPGDLPGMASSLMNNPMVKEALAKDPELLMKLLSAMGPGADGEGKPDLASMMSGLSGMFGGGAQGAGAGVPDLSSMFGAAGSAAEDKVVEEAMPELESKSKRELANEQYKNCNFEQALTLYDEAFEEDPRDLLILNNKAAVLMQMKNFDGALEIVKSAIEKRHEVNASYEVIGKLLCREAAIYKKQGKLEMALETYERAGVEDNTRKVRVAISDLKRDVQKYKEEIYFDTEKAEVAKEAGNVAFRAGKWVEAKRFYDDAIKRDPKEAKYYSNRSACYLKLLDPPNALRDIEKSLTLDPRFVKAYARKGQILERMKDYMKAMDAYKKGLDLDPSSADCQQGIQSVQFKVQAQNASSDQDPEQLARAMQDPEVQKILSDPQFQLLLKQAETNPNVLMEAMKDPKVAAGVEKLIAGGIIKTA